MWPNAESTERFTKEKNTKTNLQKVLDTGSVRGLLWFVVHRVFLTESGAT